MAPVLCSFISSKKSLVGLGWTITNIIALVGFGASSIMAGMIYDDADRKVKQFNNYRNQYNYNNNRNYGNYYGYGYNNNMDPDQQEAYMMKQMASMDSYSITFAAFYVGGLALVLAIFGGARVVGFMSLEGYVQPKWSSDVNNKSDGMYFGIFIGALVLICNLFMVLAYVFEEFQISGGGERPREEFGSFAVEDVASMIGGIFETLAVTYFSFTVLLLSLKDGVFEEMRDTRESRVSFDSYKAPSQPLYA